MDNKVIQASIGKTIEATTVEYSEFGFREVLRLAFTDGSRLDLLDDGPSRSANQYVCVDDALAKYAGSQLLGVETQGARNDDVGRGPREGKILEIRTSKGCFLLGGSPLKGAGFFQAAVGKTIEAVSLDTDDFEDALRFTFTDGTRIKLFDDGQNCSETRYMCTDDDLSYYVGAQLLGLEIKDAPNIPDDDSDECHEVQFLEVKTSKGCFTMASHNEHNGYYSGFDLAAAIDE